MTLRYLYGMTPNVSGLVKDNSPLTLPVENTTSDLTVSDPAPNSSPSAVDDTFTADEDIILNVAAPGVLSNDGDDDQDPLAAALVSTVSHGSLTLNADGSFKLCAGRRVRGQRQLHPLASAMVKPSPTTPPSRSR